MRTLFALPAALCLFTVTLPAQTRLIAHKSHSGSAATFRTVIENQLFDCEASFGAAPSPIVREAQLDSVIFINETKAVMVTSQYCRNTETTDYASLWKAGRDTVYNHPLFSKPHSLDSIRRVLHQTYYFRNSIEKTKFVGFDNAPPPAPREPKLEFENNTIPVSLEGRSISQPAEVVVKSYEVEFAVWDNNQVDGDTISLNVNGKWVLQRFKVTKEQKVLKIELKPNSNNYLILYAHNLGSLSPNTAAVSVFDGKVKKSLIMKSDMNTCGSIYFKYQPDAIKQNSLPAPGNLPPFDSRILWLLGILGMFSLAIGVTSYNLSQVKTV